MAKYHEVFGRRIAMQDMVGTKWMLANHLGSASALLDDVGNLVGNASHYPYETKMEGDAGTLTDKLFTGQH